MNPQILQPTIPAAEQRLVLEGVRWQQYETLLVMLGNDLNSIAH